jgi:hypothetical protein
MAGYSGTPLPKKLGIKEGHVVYLAGPPANHVELLTPLPLGVAVNTTLRGSSKLDVILLFAKSKAMVARRFAPLVDRMQSNAGLWVCWPKKSSGVKTDLTEAFVREYGLSTGLVDNKICAVDDTWSGLRFVIRVENR